MPRDKQPHDTFFKHRFGHREAVEDFLRNRLPQELVPILNFSTLQRKPEGFLPSDYLGRKNADVVWSIQTKEGGEIDFFLHFEAEGTPQQMAMRVLIYQALIGEAYLRENRDATKIPTIITFVLYHGKKPWVGPSSIADAYKDFKQQIAFGYETTFLINLQTEPEDKILADGRAASAELVLAAQAKCKMLDVLLKSMHLNDMPCCEQSTIDYYLIANRGKEHLVFEEMGKFDLDKANYYRTMFETVKQQLRQDLTQQLRQDLTQQLKQDFLQQGIQQGVQEGVTGTITLLDIVLRGKGLNPNLIKEIEEELQKSMVDNSKPNPK